MKKIILLIAVIIVFSSVAWADYNVFDNFNRADNTIVGNNWIEVMGTDWQVKNTQLEDIGSGTNQFIYYNLENNTIWNTGDKLNITWNSTVDGAHQYANIGGNISLLPTAGQAPLSMNGIYFDNNKYPFPTVQYVTGCPSSCTVTNINVNSGTQTVTMIETISVILIKFNTTHWNLTSYRNGTLVTNNITTLGGQNPSLMVGFGAYNNADQQQHYSGFRMIFTLASLSVPIQPTILNHSINFTSDGGKACGYNTSGQYTDCGLTEDGTPTINFQTNFSVSCKLWNESKSWSDLNNLSISDCSTTGNLNHICTFPYALQNGTQTLYISCKAGSNEYYNISNNPANMFNITIQAPIRLYQSTADDAIMYGISKSVIWPSATIFSKQPVYIRNKINNQSFATFDKVAVYGNQRWAFSYITWDDNYTIGKNFFNISPIFYFWEGVNLTYLDVTNQVTALINSTKN